ncbi:unnamed protein product [Eruca vesicaria subsp. sativa]|uniref:Uncharacterized protein n=1 Tax=Eruca vesicaria subsp. sativa TaxID=29727 RepID=A0ABC8IX49_ERUVS|nr:unnamed protein product [Eruca vesicaria subsp. sativa]
MQFKKRIKSVAVDGSDVLPAAKEAAKKASARKEAKEAAAKVILIVSRFLWFSVGDRKGDSSLVLSRPISPDSSPPTGSISLSRDGSLSLSGDGSISLSLDGSLGGSPVLSRRL